MPIRSSIKLLLVAFGCFALVGCPGGGGGGGGSSSVAGGAVATIVDPEPDVVEAPDQLACAVNMFDVFISWRNRGDYREIRINRNGSLVVTLDGEAESFSETLSETGTQTYRIFALDQEMQFLDQITCQVETQSTPSVENISGSFDSRYNKVCLDWSIPGGILFDSLRVYRGSTFLEEIADGGATGYEESNPPVGTHSYQVRSVVGGDTSGPAVCSVVVSEFGQVTSFACETDTSTGDVVLTWQNGESYDDLLVYCGGLQIDQLSGSATSYQYDFDTYGVYDFQIRGTFGVRQTDLVTCQGSVGRLAWDEDASGAVIGYYVYVWEDGASTPEAAEYVYSVDRVTTLTLLELYQNGGLPETENAVDLKIALAAFDADGEVSDLSEEISFSWKVLSLGDLN